MKEVKPKIGWVVVNNGSMIRPEMSNEPPYTYKYQSGWVEVFYQKKQAVRAAKELSEHWKCNLRVIKVKVEEVRS